MGEKVITTCSRRDSDVDERVIATCSIVMWVSDELLARAVGEIVMDRVHWGRHSDVSHWVITSCS